MANRDFYNILGVSRDASDEEIKKAYRKLSLKWHPDRHSNDSEKDKKIAETKFKEISEAYSILSDPEKKKKYDTYGDADINIDQGFGGFEQMFNGFGFFGNHFDNPFGGGFTQNDFIEAGENISMKIPLSIEDIYNGITKKVKFERKVRCPNCHGEGGTNKKTCPYCNGQGKIKNISRSGHMTFSQIVECPHCNGTGYIIGTKCPTCKGTGLKTEYNTVEVVFPAGIPNGAFRQYPNQGNESKNRKGDNGNFIAIVDYKIDENKYAINGLNVLEHIKIPYYDILLGCTYEVNIPNGKKKIITIPECTKEDNIMKIEGEGLKYNGQTGDYYVCIHYDYPTKLLEKEKEHIEFIREMKTKIRN